MIQLHRDYLLLQTLAGDFVPCSAELFSLQLIDASGSIVDQELIRHAASAVLHFFKHDLGRQSVSVAEFAQALERVLRSVGLKAASAESGQILEADISDLHSLVSQSARGLEMAFFVNLRREVKERLQHSPKVLRFRGLRGCVKELLGAKRWCRRCQTLNDQIVDYLRDCLETEAPESQCGLVVSS